MRNRLKLIVVSIVCLLGISYSLVSAGTSGLDLWMSGNNNNKVVNIQNEKQVKINCCFFCLLNRS